MQAIQRYHYDRLRGYLNLLQKEAEFYQLPEGHLLSIIEQGNKLQDLFTNYHEALAFIEILIKQYDSEYHAVRRLMHLHKQYRKSFPKNNSLQSSPIPEIIRGADDNKVL
ncbi:hypothetical protein QWZ08_14150 [Ferruginibacter paludis]|uniref:hypothetical protein n=1 Tax=Ferruginibacter paludis TaxID=1310417 RepID=UPI0025B3573F|nr:hypothetical protein [Ferruginibacter paludis]MDN3656784.1 hypothetical protein [Ferruginibacter paludis]